MRRIFAVLVWSMAVACTLAIAEPARVVENTIVYKEIDRFAGWPANNGMWTWGDDEIVVGFTLGWHKEKEGHTIDRDRPSEKRFARSLDGGKTWTLDPDESFTDPGQDAATELKESIDFSNPNFALLFVMSSSNSGFTRFFYSTDRCKSWKGPFAFPKLDQVGIMARTDYIVEGQHVMSVFMTAAKPDNKEGRPFYARTGDGGMNWEFVSYITPLPPAGGYSIMPATVRISDSEFVTIIRRREIIAKGEGAWWIDCWKSYDNGKSWDLKHNPLAPNEGNPASLHQLKDGRLVAAYGHRGEPYGLRARISIDKGETWGSEIILRDDGGRWDLGYPRTVVRPDGKLVTAYYFNEATAKERFIAATIWDPGTGDGTE
jgi:hypothetical protein